MYVTHSQSEQLPTSNNRTQKNFLPKGAKIVQRRAPPAVIAAILTPALFERALDFCMEAAD